MAIVELDTTKRKLKTLCHLQEYKEKKNHQKIANEPVPNNNSILNLLIIYQKWCCIYTNQLLMLAVMIMTNEKRLSNLIFQSEQSLPLQIPN